MSSESLEPDGQHGPSDAAQPDDGQVWSGHLDAAEAPTLIMPVLEAAAAEDEADAVPEADRLAPLATALDAVAAEIAGMRRDFDTRFRYDETKERQLDLLHKELETHRQGLHLRLIRPMVQDLIGLHDDLARLARAGAPDEPDEAARLRRSLMSLIVSVEDTLERQGVEPFDSEGDEFDAKRQRIVRRVKTDNPAQDRRTADRVGRGFQYDGRVLRPELLATYEYVAGDDPATPQVAEASE